jgi:hypothetical protein
MIIDAAFILKFTGSGGDIQIAAQQQMSSVPIDQNISTLSLSKIYNPLTITTEDFAEGKDANLSLPLILLFPPGLLV